MITGRKKVNNFQIAQVQPQRVGYLTFLLHFSLALLMKVLPIKRFVCKPKYSLSLTNFLGLTLLLQEITVMRMKRV